MRCKERRFSPDAKQQDLWLYLFPQAEHPLQGQSQQPDTSRIQHLRKKIIETNSKTRYNLDNHVVANII